MHPNCCTLPLNAKPLWLRNFTVDTTLLSIFLQYSGFCAYWVWKACSIFAASFLLTHAIMQSLWSILLWWPFIALEAFFQSLKHSMNEFCLPTETAYIPSRKQRPLTRNISSNLSPVCCHLLWTCKTMQGKTLFANNQNTDVLSQEILPVCFAQEIAI